MSIYYVLTDVRKTPIDVRSGALVVRLDITIDQACLNRNLIASSSKM